MPCFLCTQTVDDAAGNIEFASEEADSLGLRCIIEKHFWLQVNKQILPVLLLLLLLKSDLFQIPDSKRAGYVCGPCWEQLLLFHNFYLNVEQAHKALEQTVLKETSPPEVVASALEEHIVKSEHDDSVAAAVKRRRGRPRKVAQQDAREELKSVLEQINLNEIKIEFPEADLTIADVLEDQEEQDFLPDDCISKEGAEEPEVLEKKPPTLKRKVSGRSRGRRRVQFAERPNTSCLPKIQKSQEFNDYIREHYKVQCHICNLPMEDFSEMLAHVRREHKQRGYAMCCNRKFLKRGVLVDHLRRHQDPETFKCSICGRVMGHRRSLELHMRMHEIKSRGRLYRCEQCSKAFYSAVVYERHKLTHIPREQWKVPCTHCEKT